MMFQSRMEALGVVKKVRKSLSGLSNSIFDQTLASLSIACSSFSRKKISLPEFIS